MRCFVLFVVLAVHLNISASHENVISLYCNEYRPYLNNPLRSGLNCTLSNNEYFELSENSLREYQIGNHLQRSLQESLQEIHIRGGNVVIKSGTFHSTGFMAQVNITEAQTVRLEENSFNNKNITGFYLNLKNNGMVNIENRTFLGFKNKLLFVNIEDCEYVTIGEYAFSVFKEVTISGVSYLSIFDKAFNTDDDPESAIGRKIHLMSSTIDSLGHVFGPVLWEIKLERMNIGKIKGAFSMNELPFVYMINSTIETIEQFAFSDSTTYLSKFEIESVTINMVESHGIYAATGEFIMKNSRIKNMEPKSITIKSHTVVINGNSFDNIAEKSINFIEPDVASRFKSTLNFTSNHITLIERDGITVDNSIDSMTFSNNTIDKTENHSLRFLSSASTKPNFIYENNFFKQTCKCTINASVKADWLKRAINYNENEKYYFANSHCVSEVIINCENLNNAMMTLKDYEDKVCNVTKITCKNNDGSIIPFDSKFPDKKVNKLKQIITYAGIAVMILLMILIIIFTIRCISKSDNCIKKRTRSSNSSCVPICDIPETHPINPETNTYPSMYNEEVFLENKATQTLPEQLTKEYLESLKEKLDDPKYSIQAKDEIEHLYELIKASDSCNNNANTNQYEAVENIYDIPSPATKIVLTNSKKQVISVGTNTERLKVKTPYDIQTPLCNGYYEPHDMANHFYSEIIGGQRNNLLPDVIGDQAKPRGPYLNAVYNKQSSSNYSTPLNKVNLPTFDNHTLKSNGSTSKTINRPLPKQPLYLDIDEMKTTFQKR